MTLEMDHALQRSGRSLERTEKHILKQEAMPIKDCSPRASPWDSPGPELQFSAQVRETPDCCNPEDTHATTTGVIRARVGNTRDPVQRTNYLCHLLGHVLGTHPHVPGKFCDVYGIHRR